MSEFGETSSPSSTSNAAEPSRPVRRKIGGALDELDRLCTAEMARMGNQYLDATKSLVDAHADTEAALKDHLAFEADDDDTTDVDKVTPDESDNHEPESVSDNVRQRPLFRRRELPKPPRLPDDPTEEDIIAATGHLKLTPAQKIALAALVCGHTAMSAAHLAKVSPRTINRWRKEPLFSTTLDELSDTAMEASVTRMRTILLRSTHVISDSLLDSDRTRWAMRVIACPQVWKMGRRPEHTPAAKATPPRDVGITSNP